MVRASGRRVARQSNVQQPRQLPGFGSLRETIAELRRVVWPSREQTTRLTTLVIIISMFIGALLGAIDMGFAGLFRFLV